jgi:hypothetical protein
MRKSELFRIFGLESSLLTKNLRRKEIVVVLGIRLIQQLCDRCFMAKLAGLAAGRAETGPRNIPHLRSGVRDIPHTFGALG